MKTKAQKQSEAFKGDTGRSKKYFLHNPGPPAVHIPGSEIRVRSGLDKRQAHKLSILQRLCICRSKFMRGMCTL